MSDGGLTINSQNFHTKAALAVCSARANLPPAYNKDGGLRQNKWVSLVFLLALQRRHM